MARLQVSLPSYISKCSCGTAPLIRKCVFDTPVYFKYMMICILNYILADKSEGERALPRSRSKCEDNMTIMKKYVYYVGWVRDWRRVLLNKTKDFRVTWKAGNFLSSWDTVSFPLATIVSWSLNFVLYVNEFYKKRFPVAAFMIYFVALTLLSKEMWWGASQ
jgi:hypothetical protein